MKLYKCKWIKFFGYDGITFGNTVFLTEEASKDPKFIKHEEMHTIQYKRLGYFRFLATYIYYHLKFGYLNNPLEVEARRYADEV